MLKLSLNRDEGLTKILFDERIHRIIGAGIVGPNAADLISEVTLAIEMGCEAEAYDGTLTDLYIPRKR